MKPIGRKIKGYNFERKVAKMLSDWWGVENSFVRTPGSGAYAKFVGEDLKERLRGDLITPREFPFFVECKCVEAFEFHLLLQSFEKSLFKNWFDELEKKCKDYYPMLVFSRNRWKVFVCIRGCDLQKLRVNIDRKMVLGVGEKEYVFCLLEEFLKSVSPEIVKNFQKNKV